MADDSSPVRLTASHAIFAVADVPAAVRFYRDCLGFTSEWLWGEPPDFGGVNWGKVGVMFMLAPRLAAKVEGHGHAFDVEGVDRLYERHRQNGAPIISEIENKPWGLREYTVRDPNGYHLRFGEPVTPRASTAPAKTLPDNIKVIERCPTVDEYTHLMKAVGWLKERAPEVDHAALRNSLYGVIAVDGDAVVGMARLVGDGAKVYYVQDVMVQPEYQRQGIGHALMTAVMNYFDRSTPPHSSIGLFTGRRLNGFYERHGFQGPETFLYGMYRVK